MYKKQKPARVPIEDWCKKYGITMYKMRGDTTVRYFCVSCGKPAYANGMRLCPTCFATYGTYVLQNDVYAVVIHPACYNNTAPVIAHLKKVSSTFGVNFDTNPSTDHSHWYTKRSSDEFGWVNEQVRQDWVDAVRYATTYAQHVNPMKNRG